MSSKKKPQAPAAKASNVISLDALLGNWPMVELAGVRFEGRHFSQREKAAWLKAEQGGDPEQQCRVVLDAIRARGAEVTMEWVEAQPDVFLVAVVTGLYGSGWPGETPKQ